MDRESKRFREWLAFPAGVSVDPRRRERSAGKASMKNFWKQLRSDTRGQDLVEYALAAGLVAVAAVAAMPSLSTTVSNVFAKIGSIINSSVT